ncbi:imidazole glycerol phosphate synthase subunit HisH [Clostridium botulinum]|uniref:imidazole glycerol phosphate synthase subunit HisH n=1 Tax=Clostridium botulinum TaxID=1491 RepID=UPI0019683308|nr:imidazole glycerol phosphate synthase subunit HisH [Clostridium botulinum]MBN1059495.1 imidazole glycerol phosphate synthase subunit HisH [Clostridium botulinum]MBN1062615.1 imidazole glycerol phosphate synthase subunit HisH [Clostridium botulinum]
MIVIIDYGMGNLKSISNALNNLEIENKISSDKDEIENSKGIILPGVGGFKDAMCNIKEKSLDTLIKKEAENGKPLFGICLGMQLLFEKGFEGYEEEGLGLLKGNIVKLKEDKNNNVKIPHIGWNSLIYNKNDEFCKCVEEGNFVYYVHSYYAQEYDANDLVAYSEYGINKIPGVVRHKNIIGAQFHPEKSGDVGLRLLKNFGELIK